MSLPAAGADRPVVGRPLVLGSLLVAGLAAATGAAAAAELPDRLDLPVAAVVEPLSAYREFCLESPAECVMSGPSTIRGTDAELALLARVNADVNGAIRLMPDEETCGFEERWRLPVRGVGDCEDIALEKRRRLAVEGLPRAAMTIAVVHHRHRPIWCTPCS